MTTSPPEQGLQRLAAVKRRIPIAALVLVAFTAPARAEETESSSHAIVGGDLATPGQWPEVVAMIFEAEKKGDTYQAKGACSGVLIAPDAVATAAHCFLTPEELEDQVLENLPPLEGRTVSEAEGLLLGAINEIPLAARIEDSLAVSNTVDLREAQEGALLVGYRLHPEYVGQFRRLFMARLEALANQTELPSLEKFDHDLAIAYLAEPMATQPAVLANADFVASGTLATAVGYGTSDAMATRFDGRLRELKVTIDQSICNGPNTCTPGLEVAVRGPGFDQPCKGDSGGPLFVTSPQGTVVGGILSRIVTADNQRPCGGYPLVYGRTDVAASWYHHMLALGPPQDPDGCGCRAPGSAGSGALSLLLGLLASVPLWRRRAASRR